MVSALKLSDLASWTSGRIVRGDPGRGFTGMAAIDQAGPDDISFFGNENIGRSSPPPAPEQCLSRTT